MDNSEFIAVQAALGLDNSEVAAAMGRPEMVIVRYRQGGHIPDAAGKQLWLLYGANYGVARTIVAILQICHGGKMTGAGVIAEKLHWIGYRFTRSTMPGTSLHQLAKQGELVHVRHGVYAIADGAEHKSRRANKKKGGP